MRKELRIGGFGGQGVILAGIILGKAACLLIKMKQFKPSLMVLKLVEELPNVKLLLVMKN